VRPAGRRARSDALLLFAAAPERIAFARDCNPEWPEMNSQFRAKGEAASAERVSMRLPEAIQPL
jgi:hypothetical protein